MSRAVGLSLGQTGIKMSPGSAAESLNRRFAFLRGLKGPVGLLKKNIYLMRNDRLVLMREPPQFHKLSDPVFEPGTPAF
jgi:hypothetical protein